MTNREALEMITTNTSMPAELIKWASNELTKLDAKNEAARARTAKKSAEKDSVHATQRAAIMAVLTADYQTAPDLIAAAGLEDVKPQAMPRIMGPAVEDGSVDKGEFKPAGAKTKVVGYRLPVAQG